MSPPDCVGMSPDELNAGLARVCARAGLGAFAGRPQRLTGGAVMESWRFAAGEESFVLRRAPSLAFMEGRPYGHSTEAALIEAARAKGVTAPQVVAVLDPADELGSGFVMRALPGTADPKVILACDDPAGLLRQAARDLARIHRLRQADVPEGVPVMDYRAAIADLKQQFMEAGGDRPIIALGLKWLEDNCPPQVEPVLNHGDYRMGNLLVKGSALTGVLDWEIAHFGDRHEDLAFGCMAVWRFARYDRPALGLGSIADYIAAYEAESGTSIDPARFRFWTIYRTVWWALGCLKMAAQWRSGADRMLERVVISRRRRTRRKRSGRGVSSSTTGRSNRLARRVMQKWQLPFLNGSPLLRTGWMATIGSSLLWRATPWGCSLGRSSLGRTPVTLSVRRLCSLGKFRWRRKVCSPSFVGRHSRSLERTCQSIRRSRWQERFGR